jgi:hypothetical protein
MTQQEVGWFCVAFGAFYTVGLSAFPPFFNTWLLCPRWGIFGPPASRLSGIGGGLILVSLGLVHLNTAYSTAAPAWLPWTLVVVSALVMVTGIARDPLYKGAA